MTESIGETKEGKIVLAALSRWNESTTLQATAIWRKLEEKGRHLDRGDASALLDTMEVAGLVTSWVDALPDDKNYRLTDAGLQLARDQQSAKSKANYDVSEKAHDDADMAVASFGNLDAVTADVVADALTKIKACETWKRQDEIYDYVTNYMKQDLYEAALSAIADGRCKPEDAVAVARAALGMDDE